MMKSKYKIKFELKQHTPLIHFQAEQQGATLRASELKPKLDRFLIKHAALTEIKDEKEVPKGDCKGWFINEEKLALDYKVKVELKSGDKLKIEDNDEMRIPTFFANMGGEYKNNEKWLCFSKYPITVTIHSFHPGLIKLLTRQLLQAFFLRHNFGSRQSKGFGCFTLEGEHFDPDNFDLYFDLNTDGIPQSVLTADIPRGGWEDFMKLSAAIDIFYKNLRSGINRKNRNGGAFYIKPAIFLYAKTILKKQWDKKSIKQHFYTNGQLENERNDHPNSDILLFSDCKNPHIMIKDVFGLSSSEKWGNPQLEKTHDWIQRFQSPLLFKPLNIGKNTYRIGVFSTPIEKAFLDEAFDITYGGWSGLTLKTPENFEWKDFWTFYFSNQFPVLDDRVDQRIANYRGTHEYNVLHKIEQTICSPYKTTES